MGVWALAKHLPATGSAIRRGIAALAVAMLALSQAGAQEPAPPDLLPPVTQSLLTPTRSGEMLRFLPQGEPRPVDASGSETLRLGQTTRGSQLVVLQQTQPPSQLSSLPQNLPPVSTVAAQQAVPPNLLPKAGRDKPPATSRGYYFASQQEPTPPADSDSEDASASDNGDNAEGEDAKDGEGKEKEKKDEQKFGREPESTTMQFLRTQDVLLKPCTWQFDTGFAYAHFDNPFPANVHDGSGNLTEVVQGDIRRRLLYTPLGFRYGWSKNVQLFGYLPAGFSNTQTSTLGTSVDRNSGGIGDLTAGTSLHIFGAQDDLPDVIGTFAFTAPTGNFNAPVFGVVPGQALGQGFWAASAQLLCINQYDPIVVFYGGGYRHLFKREFDGVPFAAGEQINYMLGVGFAVNDRVTLSGTFQGFYITNFELNNQVIVGSNLEPLSMRLAATITRRGHILEPFVYIGMTPSAPSALFGITLTYY